MPYDDYDYGLPDAFGSINPEIDLTDPSLDSPSESEDFAEAHRRTLARQHSDRMSEFITNIDKAERVFSGLSFDFVSTAHFDYGDGAFHNDGHFTIKVGDVWASYDALTGSGRIDGRSYKGFDDFVADLLYLEGKGQMWRNAYQREEVDGD